MPARPSSPLPLTALCAGALLVSSACSGGPGVGENTGAVSATILNGTTASAYPEAALVDMTQTGSSYGGFCSASLIAPQVILTAGHCVKGVMSATTGTLIPDTWKVTLPYNGNQTFTSHTAATFDWVTTDGTVDMSTHDIGLVFLPTAAAITPDQCPALATMPIADGTQIVNIGRIQSGTLSMTDLFVGAPVSVTASQFYPFDYQSADIIEEGDSGGPDEIPGSTPHLIVAVNSGGGTGGGTSQQVLARVDLLNDAASNWIAQQVMANGGWCSPSSGGSSGSSGGSNSGSTSGSTSGASGGTSGSSGSSSSTSGGSGSTSGGSASSAGGSSGSGGTDGIDAGGATNTDWNNARTSAGCACDTAGTDRGAPNGLAVVGLASLAAATSRRRRRA